MRGDGSQARSAISARTLVAAWNEFFFLPQSPTPVALFRIVYGLLVLADLILLSTDWLTWFGPHAMLSIETMHRFAPGTRINLFTLLPPNDLWIWTFFWVFLTSAVFLVAGLFTRTSSIIVYLCLASIHERNIFILNSGDTLLRVTGFFLMFAPAGGALSADRLIRIWKGKEGPEIQRCSPWAQRMIQLQVALLYLVTAWWKSTGADWINGTALHYVYKLDEFRRLPIPSWLQSPVMVKLGSWMTLVAEFSLGILVWIRELRYAILLLGLFLHLSLEYTMNVPLFQWIIISTYITFVDPRDLARFWNSIRVRAVAYMGEPVTVIYDGGSVRIARAANVLRAVDVFHRLQLVDLRSRWAAYGLSRKQGHNRLLVSTPSGLREGFGGLSYLARVVPLLWPLAISSFFADRSKETFSTAKARRFVE
jgi:hypothetical protein